MILSNSRTQVFLIVFLNVVWAQMDTEESKGQLKKSFGSLLKNIVNINEKRVSALKKLNNLQDFIVTKNSLAKIHGYDLDDDDSAEDLRDQHDTLTFVDMRNKLTLRRTYSKEQATVKSSINITVPFKSFHVKSEYTNNENNRIGNRNEYNDNIEDKNFGNEKRRNNYNNLNTDDINYRDRKLKVNDYNVNMYKRNYNSDINCNINENNNNDHIGIRKKGNYDKKDRGYIDMVSRKHWRGSCDKNAAKTCRSACVDAHKNGCMIYKCSRRAKKAFSKECKRSCRNKFLSGRYYSDSDSEWE